jgi:hypothetical protein
VVCEGVGVQKALKLERTPNIILMLRNKLIAEIPDCASEPSLWEMNDGGQV